ncbi:MAG TPA: hypothetical protein VN673_03385, partial [Clostridia bacterium]|nr:hypothetical protein [Clostridia bacterium]
TLNVFGLLGILMILGDYSGAMVFVWAGVCALLMVLILIGCFAARLESAPSANHALQATAAPPRS